MSNFTGKVAFLTFSCCRGNLTNNGHTTPVLIERSSGHIRAMVMDSRGWTRDNPGGYYVNRLLSTFDKTGVYVPALPRQMDYHSCSIFSLNDIVQFFRDKDFFRPLKDIKVIESEGQKVRIVQALPAAYMKLTQSRNVLNTWAGPTKNSSATKTLFSYFNRKQLTDFANRPRNAAALFRKIKFLERINRQIEKSSTEKCLAVTQRHDASKFLL